MDTELVRGAAGLGGTAVVVGLVQIVKGWVADRRWWPVVALGFGVAWSLVVALVLGGRLEVAAIEGVIIGLAASGLWSAGKTGVEGD